MSLRDWSSCVEADLPVHLRTLCTYTDSLLSSSQTYCDSIFFVSSSCTNLMFWKNPCWSTMGKETILQFNDVVLEETNDRCTSHFILQPLTCMSDGPPQLRISGVNFQALPSCEHCISSCSLQLSFLLGVSTPASPWSPSLLRWDHQFRCSPVLSTCPLHTKSGCGKERRILIGPW